MEYDGKYNGKDVLHTPASIQQINSPASLLFTESHFFSVEVIFYSEESYYLASSSPLFSSPQPTRLCAILLCHFNLFPLALLLSFDLQPIYVCASLCLCVCVRACASMFGLWNLLSWSLVKVIR